MVTLLTNMHVSYICLLHMWILCLREAGTATRQPKRHLSNMMLFPTLAPLLADGGMTPEALIKSNRKNK